ncbi:MAG: hypothetical protein V9E94_21285 [Microthrixaceae bacterium]
MLDEGAAGYAYLLKDRVADGNRLARAIREVATGGSMLDPEIVQALVSPVACRRRPHAEAEESLLRQVAEGRPVKAIAASLGTTPEAVNDAIEALFLVAGEGRERGTGERAASAAAAPAGDRRPARSRARRLSRLLPAGIAERLRDGPRGVRAAPNGSQVTVLMSDVRGYSGIAERTDPTVLAGHAQRPSQPEMNAAILGARAARSCSTWATR